MTEQTDLETWITRCPECQTAFRITKAHITAANGSVRCGSCLHVFKANDYILRQELPTQELSIKDSVVEASDYQLPETPYEHQNTEEETDEEWARNILAELDTTDDPHLESETLTPEKITSETTARHEASAHPSIQADSQALDNLNDDPLQLHYQKKSLIQPLLWSAASLLALAVLAGQYVQANFTELAFNQNTRPALTTLCNLAGCVIPKLRDTTLIKASQIIVRPDVEYQNSLTIDAIITNTATFSQPYPPISLSVKDSTGSISGSRVLEPENYLSGEAAGALLMTSEQPVHLSFRIISPGKDSKSVNFDFL